MMSSETATLIATLTWVIDTEKARRRFDTPDQAQEDGEYSWSPEMQAAMEQLEKLKSGELVVVKGEVYA